MSCVSYPGIIRIGYIFVDDCPANSVYNALAGIPINIFLSPNPIPLAGKADCQVEASNDHNGTAETLTLTFQSVVQLPPNRAIAFIVTDANGKTFLVGQPERPYLSIKSTRQFGSPSEGSNIFAYEVKETAPICLKPCKIMV